MKQALEYAQQLVKYLPAVQVLLAQLQLQPFPKLQLLELLQPETLPLRLLIRPELPVEKLLALIRQLLLLDHLQERDQAL